MKVKALNKHKNYSTVFLTEGKEYHFTAMQPSPVATGATAGNEYMVTNDKGTEKWHHESWFDKKVIL